MFDDLHLTRRLTADEWLMRAREIAVFARVEAAEVDNDNQFPVETFARLAQAGLLAVNLPVEFGGAGLGLNIGATAVLLRVLKIIGSGNLAVGRVFEGHINALQLLAAHATPEQMRVVAADVIEKRKLFGVWNTEAADGVKIVETAGKFQLSGAKTFASGAGFVERPVVNAAWPDKTWQMTVVPMDAVQTATDENWWRPLGMRATRSHKVDFANVELQAADLIGAPNVYYQQPWFGAGAIRFAAVQLGGAESLFDLTRAYLRELKRTDCQIQQQRVGEMAIAIEAGNLWLTGAANAADDFWRQPDAAMSKRFLHYANQMRTAIEQICQTVMLHCERAVGARGLMRPYHFERIIRDLTIYLRQPAPDAALSSVGCYALEDDRATDLLWRA